MVSAWHSAFTKSFRRSFDPVDLGLLGVDMHSHLVPAIDDGVKTVDEAMEVVRAMSALGYRKLVTTPHVMADHYKNDPETIRGGLAAVQAAAAAEELDIELEAAAEYLLDDGFLHLLERGSVLAFGPECLLFELPFMHKPAHLETAVFEMRTRGYQPVLAHPERYPYFHERGSGLDVYRGLVEQGVWLQLNLGSLVNAYGEEERRTARKLIDAGLVRLVGSDIHSPRHLPMLEAVRRDRHFKRLLDSGRLANPEL